MQKLLLHVWNIFLEQKAPQIEIHYIIDMFLTSWMIILIKTNSALYKFARWLYPWNVFCPNFILKDTNLVPFMETSNSWNNRRLIKTSLDQLSMTVCYIPYCILASKDILWCSIAMAAKKNSCFHADKTLIYWKCSFVMLLNWCIVILVFNYWYNDTIAMTYSIIQLMCRQNPYYIKSKINRYYMLLWFIYREDKVSWVYYSTSIVYLKQYVSVK